jgi:hypothetical protein
MKRCYIFYFKDGSFKLSVILLLISFEFTLDQCKKEKNIKVLFCEIKNRAINLF